MIIHFYLSDKRVKDLCLQIDPNFLTETVKKIDKELTVKGEVKGGLPGWLSFLGFSGEGTLGTEGKIAFSEEIKPMSSEYALLSILKKYILTNEFNFVDETSKFDNINSSEIIRAKGKFRMCIDGENAMDRIAKFETMPYIEWEGIFNDLKIKFGTTRENYLARTAIFQCLSFPDVSSKIDFFGTITRVHKKSNENDENYIEALPLFFGVEIDF